MTLKVESLEKDLRVINCTAEYLITMCRSFGMKPSLSLLIRTANFKKWVKAIDNIEKHKNG